MNAQKNLERLIEADSAHLERAEKSGDAYQVSSINRHLLKAEIRLAQLKDRKAKMPDSVLSGKGSF